MYGLKLQKKIEEELLRGRGIATKLLMSHVVTKRSYSPEEINNITSGHVSKGDVDLVLKIFESFENCIDLLSTCTTAIPDDHAFNFAAATTCDQEKSADNYNIIGVDAKISPKYEVNHRPNSEEDGVNYNCITNPIIGQNQINAHNKRRKLSTGIRETINSPFLVDDGHAWRKYGQKMIRNAKYSRDYFRCINKDDQGCKATKQVQKISDNPAVYKTIHQGHHTCIKDLSSPNNYDDLDHHDDYSSGFIISFGKTNHNNKLLTDKKDYPSFESTKNDQPKPVVLVDNDQYIDQQQHQSMLSPDHHDLMIKATFEPLSGVLSPTLKSDPLDVDFGDYLECHQFDFNNILNEPL